MVMLALPTAWQGRISSGVRCTSSPAVQRRARRLGQRGRPKPRLSRRRDDENCFAPRRCCAASDRPARSAPPPLGTTRGNATTPSSELADSPGSHFVTSIRTNHRHDSSLRIRASKPPTQHYPLLLRVLDPIAPPLLCGTGRGRARSSSQAKISVPSGRGAESLRMFLSKSRSCHQLLSR
jgi:hypothetical protein